MKEKTLLLILGPNGVGKTTAAQALVESRPHTAWVDADWCRAINPFLLTEDSEKTVEDNLSNLLFNYLSCPIVDTVVFSYGLHGDRAQRLERVLKRLDAAEASYRLKKVILTCSEEVNRKRAAQDGRDAQRINRGIRNTLHFYDHFPEPKIDTTFLTPDEVVQKIIAEAMTEFRMLKCPEDITRQLFRDFERRQDVGLCWRKKDGEWIIKEDPFVDDWTEADYEELILCLRRTVQTGGFLCAAFTDGVLKGFASVESCPLGLRSQYLELSSLHVSRELRGAGIGKKLFARAAQWAREQGGEKLYISAHSAAETQAFYRSLGCRDALEPSRAHVEKEPYDCQLEYIL